MLKKNRKIAITCTLVTGLTCLSTLVQAEQSDAPHVSAAKNVKNALSDEARGMAKKLSILKEKDNSNETAEMREKVKDFYKKMFEAVDRVAEGSLQGEELQEKAETIAKSFNSLLGPSDSPISAKDVLRDIKRSAKIKQNSTKEQLQESEKFRKEIEKEIEEDSGKGMLLEAAGTDTSKKPEKFRHRYAHLKPTSSEDDIYRAIGEQAETAAMTRDGHLAIFIKEDRKILANKADTEVIAGIYKEKGIEGLKKIMPI